jgi:hypothetical protein
VAAGAGATALVPESELPQALKIAAVKLKARNRATVRSGKSMCLMVILGGRVSAMRATRQDNGPFAHWQPRYLLVKAGGFASLPHGRFALVPN